MKFFKILTGIGEKNHTESEDLVEKLLSFYMSPRSSSFLPPKNALMGPDKEYYDKKEVKKWIDINHGYFISFYNPDDIVECSAPEYNCLSDPPYLVKNIYDKIKEEYPDIVKQKYFEFDGTTLLKYNGDDKIVTIPQGITHISEEVFFGNDLTEVIFPSSLTHIGEKAFVENKLTKVTFPSSLTHIGEKAFSQNKLTEVTFPSSLTYIGEKAFFQNKLTKVTFPSSLRYIEKEAFSQNKLTEVAFSSPSSLTKIGEFAFYKNELTQVALPSSLTEIGVMAFSENKLPLTQVIGIF